MGILLAIVGMAVSAVAGIMVLGGALMRASRKGYQAGTTLVVLLLGTALGFGLFVVAIDLVNGYALTVLAPLIILATPAFLLLMLPRRKPRRIFTVQRVTFPYATIGQVIFIIACVATAILSLLSWWTGDPVWLAAMILVPGLAIAFMLRGLFIYGFAQPQRAVASLGDVIAADPRHPVIFMRAFDREGLPFVNGDKSKYRQYSRGAVLPKQTAVQIPLDEYLGPAIERRIGPFLALGNPQDYYTPHGAVRAYFKDETWMDEFRELAQRAGCLLLEASESSNLRWELQYLRQSNLHDRLVVVAGHPTKPYDSSWIQLGAHMAGVPPMSWEHFAAMLKELGYQVPSGEPETGSVIGFDSEARAKVLTSDADLPDDFVEPIEAWLDGHRDLGRCVEVACTKCGRVVFKRSGTPPDTFACRPCRGGSPVIRAALGLLRVIAGAVTFLACIGVFLVPHFLGWTARWMMYAWLVFVFISAVFLWQIASAIGRRLAARLGVSPSLSDAADRSVGDGSPEGSRPQSRK